MEEARELTVATPTMKMTALQAAEPQAPPVPERLPATQLPKVLAAILISRSELVTRITAEYVFPDKGLMNRYVSAIPLQLYVQLRRHCNCDK